MASWVQHVQNDIFWGMMVVKARGGGGLITIISPNPAIFRNLCFSAHSQYQVFFPAFPRFFYSFLCPVLRINSPLPGRETSLLVNCILFWGWFLTNWPPLAFLSHFGGGGIFGPLLAILGCIGSLDHFCTFVAFFCHSSLLLAQFWPLLVILCPLGQMQWTLVQTPWDVAKPAKVWF